MPEPKPPKQRTIPASPCPYCDLPEPRGGEAFGSDPPEIGDFSVCLRCGGLSRFIIGLHRVKASDGELNDQGLKTVAQLREIVHTLRGPFPYHEKKR